MLVTQKQTISLIYSEEKNNITLLKATNKNFIHIIADLIFGGNTIVLDVVLMVVSLLLIWWPWQQQPIRFALQTVSFVGFSAYLRYFLIT